MSGTPRNSAISNNTAMDFALLGYLAEPRLIAIRQLAEPLCDHEVVGKVLTDVPALLLVEVEEDGLVDLWLAAIGEGLGFPAVHDGQARGDVVAGGWVEDNGLRGLSRFDAFNVA